MSNATSPRLAKVATAAPSCAQARKGVSSRFVYAAVTLLFVIAMSGVGIAAESEGPLAGVVNLNTASIEELKLLPGVGEARAEAIVTLRNEQGGFTSVEELMEVKGVGPKMMKRLRPHITLVGETTAARH